MCIHAGAFDLLIEWVESRVKMVWIAFENKIKMALKIKEKKIRK